MALTCLRHYHEIMAMQIYRVVRNGKFSLNDHIGLILLVGTVSHATGVDPGVAAWVEFQ
jgi:hypothetical protein